MRINLPLVVLALLGASLLWLATADYGLALSDDSAEYIASARNMAGGHGAISLHNDPLVVHAPLYPALLASISAITGVDAILSARIANTVLFALVITLAGLLFSLYAARSIKSSIRVVLLATLFICIGFPLVETAFTALSELLFILLTLLYLFCLESCIATAKKKWLVFLIVTVALACLTRYIGIILIFTGAISLFLSRRDNSKISWQDLFIFVIASSLPITLWLTRNYFIAGTFFGPRASSIYSASQNLLFTFDTILTWYVPKTISIHVPVIFLFIISMSVFAVLIYISKPVRTRNLLILVIGYVTFLIASSSRVAYDPIGNRLLAPVFIPITLFIVLFIVTVLDSAYRNFSKKMLPVFLAVIIAAAFVYPLRQTFLIIKNNAYQGSYYSSQSWKDSPIVAYLNNNPSLLQVSHCTFYSNSPEAAYLLAHLETRLSPARTMYHSTEIVNDLSGLLAHWPEETPACLIWFDNTIQDRLFSIAELRGIANIDPIIHFEDGAIYSVSKK